MHTFIGRKPCGRRKLFSFVARHVHLLTAKYTLKYRRACVLVADESCELVSFVS
jgi:hypothetical protein